jgi:hypothetical protein
MPSVRQQGSHDVFITNAINTTSELWHIFYYYYIYDLPHRKYMKKGVSECH